MPLLKGIVRLQHFLVIYFQAVPLNVTQTCVFCSQPKPVGICF